jgi:hypothetical protein
VQAAAREVGPLPFEQFGLGVRQESSWQEYGPSEEMIWRTGSYSESEMFGQSSDTETQKTVVVCISKEWQPASLYMPRERCFRDKQRIK